MGDFNFVWVIAIIWIVISAINGISKQQKKQAEEEKRRQMQGRMQQTAQPDQPEADRQMIPQANAGQPPAGQPDKPQPHTLGGVLAEINKALEMQNNAKPDTSPLPAAQPLPAFQCTAEKEREEQEQEEKREKARLAAKARSRRDRPKQPQITASAKTPAITLEREALRRAVIMAEILGPPKSKSQWSAVSGQNTKFLPNKK
ncbi:MAG: hypothetical protein FWF85_08865 [Clostridiales bacterium]|nr:hypothetical protein [Clostridiales bacterium]